MVDISFEDNAIWYMLIALLPFIVLSVKSAFAYCKEVWQAMIEEIEETFKE